MNWEILSSSMARTLGTGCANSCPTRLRFVASRDGSSSRRWMGQSKLLMYRKLCPSLIKTMKRFLRISLLAASGRPRRMRSSKPKSRSMELKTGWSSPNTCQADSGASAERDGITCLTHPSSGGSGLEKKTSSSLNSTRNSVPNGPKSPRWSPSLAEQSARLRIATTKTWKAKISRRSSTRLTKTQ